MDKFEMIEKLSAKANVTLDEAKEALEASDWDMLDALLLLERQGKANEEQTAQEYTTQKKKEYCWNTKHSEVRVEIGSWPSRLWERFKNLVRKGNTNQFVVTRKDEELIAMPITVLVVLLACFWPLSIIILFLGLFLKARYSFRGPNVSDRVNDVISAAQEKTANAVQVHRYNAQDEDRE